MTDAVKAPSPAREWLTVSVCFTVYGALFLDRLAPLFLVALIARDLGVPSAAEGTLALLIGVGYAAAMPIVRATSGRWRDQPRIRVTMLLTAAIGAMSAAAPGWAVFIVLRGISGLAAGAGAPAINVLVFTSSRDHRRGRNIGIVLSSTRWVGSFIAPIVVTAVTVATSWRIALIVSAALLAVSTIFLTRLQDPATHGRGRPPAPATFALHPGGRRNLAVCAVGCSVLLAWLVIWSQSGLALFESWLDMGPARAGQTMALFGISAGIASLAVPYASDRLGRRAALQGSSVLGGAGGVLLAIMAMVGTTPPAWALAAAVLASGVAMGGLPLVLALIPAETVATGDVSRGLLVPIAAAELIGAATMPALAAVLAARMGLASVLGIAAAAVLSFVVLAGLLRPMDASPRAPTTTTR